MSAQQSGGVHAAPKALCFRGLPAAKLRSFLLTEFDLP